MTSLDFAFPAILASSFMAIRRLIAYAKYFLKKVHELSINKHAILALGATLIPQPLAR